MIRASVLSTVASVALVSAAAHAQSSYQRPLSDFLSHQGTTIGYTPPVADYFSFTDPARGLLISADYAGVADKWVRDQTGGAVSFGTQISGSITETPLADGSAKVQILVHARNALTYVVGFDPVNGGNFSDVKFGSLAPDALASGDAALGDCTFKIWIVNSAPHAPIPDLFDVIWNGNNPTGIQLLYISMECHATGTLHAGAISGVPEGTQGTAQTTQVGLFMNGHLVGDGGFPVENIRLRAH